MEIDRRRLRPMGIGDILDEAFYLYRGNFALLVGICAVIYVPLYILIAILGTAFGEAVPVAGQLVRSFFFDFLITGALAYAVSQVYLAHLTTVGDSYRFIGRRFLSYIWTQVLATFVAILPVAGVAAAAAVVFPLLFVTGTISDRMMIAVVIMVTLLIAGLVFTVFLAIRLTVVLPVFVVEGSRGIDALRRSYRLVAGFGLKVFVVMVLVQVIVGVLLMVVSTLPEILLQGSTKIVVAATLDAVANAVLVPVIALAYILIYYDLRIRKEGFDLEILAQELEARKQVGEPQTAGHE